MKQHETALQMLNNTFALIYMLLVLFVVLLVLQILVLYQVLLLVVE